MAITNGLRTLASLIYRFFFPIELVTMYKKMGVKIGSNCKFQFDVVIDYSHYWLVEIGNNVTLAPRVHILAHDASTKQLFNYTRLGKVEIGNNVFIGAGSIILPGIKIGNNSIIGAGSVVSNSIPENSVAAGNPCKIICSIQEFESKRKEEFESSYKFDESYTLRGNITIEKKEEMIQKMNQTIFTYVI